MRSTPSLRSFPNVVFETVPISFVWLTMGLASSTYSSFLCLFPVSADTVDSVHLKLNCIKTCHYFSTAEYVYSGIWVLCSCCAGSVPARICHSVCAFRKIIAKCLQGDDVGLNVLKLSG